MKEDLKCVCEVDQMCVMRAEDDGFARLTVAQMKAEDMMYEQMRLSVLSASS